MYDRSLFVTPGQLCTLASMLADEDVQDIQNTEYVLLQLAGGDAIKLPNGVGERIHHRAGMLDKFALGELCRLKGIPVPDTLSASDHGPDEAIARLGLPLVVKQKVGASGLGVRIASREEEVTRALRELAPIEDLFYERYIQGEYVDYSAVAGFSGPVQESLTRTASAVGTAPPSAIEVIHDPELLAAGRRAVAALGLVGFIHIDGVLDAQRRYWLLDINLRAWGSMVSLRMAGIDFAAGYLATLGLGDIPPQAYPRLVTLTAFTGVVDEQISRGRIVGTLWTFLRYAPAFIRMLGLRYGAAQLLACMVAAVGTRLHRLRAY